jgi:predicted naringenin-chalcone synthase
MSFAIWGFGTALPESSLSQDRAAELINRASGFDAEQSAWVGSVYRGAGVGRRHLLMLDHIDEILESAGSNPPRHTMSWRMGRYDEAIRTLSHQASSRALASAGVAAGEITHLVTVSCTGFAAPGFDLALFASLGLDPGAQRTHVGFMGCHGALNGLRVANAFASANRSAKVLVCSAELPSLHFRYEPNPRQTIVNALFGDGAAAVVVGTDPRPDDAHPWRLEASGSTVIPDSEDAMTWKLGDRAFEMTLAPGVAGLVRENLRRWLQGWLGDRGMAIGDVASWAIHPGGPKILDAAEDALGLPRSATSVSREILAEFGNMSSPTILFILDRLRARRAPRPCVSLGFGPGLAIEAALFV